MDAIILAGGESPEDLAAITDCRDRALLPLAGHPMVTYVIDAVRGAPNIERLAVVGSEATRQFVAARYPDTILVPDTGNMIGNARAAMQVMGMPLAVVTTCDVPLVTAGTYTELLAEFHRRSLEAAYAVATRTTCEAAFPHGKRTYAHLTEDDYTAGNAVIVSGAIVEQMSIVFEQFFKARKNPLAMAKLLGFNFLLKAASRRLSVRDAERKMAELVGCNAGAVEMKDAAIAFDVDKMDDYRVVERTLQQRAPAHRWVDSLNSVTQQPGD